MRDFLKPLLIFGLVILIVVVVSWFAFPGWRKQPGGLIVLIGGAVVGVIAVAKNVIDIAKGWRDLAKPPVKEAISSPRPRKPVQIQHTENSEGSEQNMKRSGGDQIQSSQGSPHSKQTME